MTDHRQREHDLELLDNYAHQVANAEELLTNLRQEQRRYVLRAVFDHGLSLATVAKRAGLHRRTVTSWVETERAVRNAN